MKGVGRGFGLGVGLGVSVWVRFEGWFRFRFQATSFKTQQSREERLFSGLRTLRLPLGGLLGPASAASRAVLHQHVRHHGQLPAGVVCGTFPHCPALCCNFGQCLSAIQNCWGLIPCTPPGHTTPSRCGCGFCGAPWGMPPAVPLWVRLPPRHSPTYVLAVGLLGQTPFGRRAAILQRPQRSPAAHVTAGHPREKEKAGRKAAAQVSQGHSQRQGGRGGDGQAPGAGAQPQH